MKNKGIIYSSKKCLNYCAPDHPETPARVAKSIDRLASKGFVIKEPSPAKEKDILKAHSEKHFISVKEGSYSDQDTLFLAGIFSIALLSAGGALAALKSAWDGIPAFSLAPLAPPAATLIFPTPLREGRRGAARRFLRGRTPRS